MDYQQLLMQRRTHPAWRLLAADHAPLIASFLHRHFIEPNVRTIARQQLASLLDDYLFLLHEQAGEVQFPKAATAYLDDWASDERGWLRKYYPAGQDEASYDLTSSTETAINWLNALGQRQFIGTESRLMTVFDLLRQIVDGTELSPRARIAELQRRKAAIDAEIEQIGQGRLDMMDDTQIRERFLQMADTARALLSDFRAVDQNFRSLDRAVRERIATWEGSKGELLEEIFGRRDVIADSDEGKSFRAFWDLLMSPSRQDELSALLKTVLALAPLQGVEAGGRLQRIHYDWLEAGEVTQRTVARLSEQLRRYLDDQAWLENRRIMQLIRDIEQKALAARDQVDARAFIELDEASPELALPMDRTLYAPPSKPVIRQRIVADDGAVIAADALFEQVYVDRLRLLSNVRLALQSERQVTLGNLVRQFPLQQGLAELATYLSLATQEQSAAIDDSQSERIVWNDTGGHLRAASVPLLIFHG